VGGVRVPHVWEKWPKGKAAGDQREFVDRQSGGSHYGVAGFVAETEEKAPKPKEDDEDEEEELDHGVPAFPEGRDSPAPQPVEEWIPVPLDGDRPEPLDVPIEPKIEVGETALAGSSLPEAEQPDLLGPQPEDDLLPGLPKPPLKREKPPGEAPQPPDPAGPLDLPGPPGGTL